MICSATGYVLTLALAFSVGQRISSLMLKLEHSLPRRHPEMQESSFILELWPKPPKSI
jgi:hypothetical protein